MKQPCAITFVGRSNSGKTTLVSALIAKLAGRGLAVSAIKHSGKNVEMDKKGKDSWRFKEAGARGVMLYAENRIYYNLALEKPVSINDMIGMLREPVDIVLVEGFKNSGLPAVVVINSEKDIEEMMRLENIIAVVSDIEFPAGLPRFKRDDIEKITEFILSRYSQNQPLKHESRQ